MNVQNCSDKAWLLSEEAFDLYAPCMYKPTFQDYKTKMEAYISDPNIEFFICKDDEEIAGILVLDKQEAEIIGISVNETKRHKGIGRALIAYVMDHERPDHLKAQTDDDEIGFYRKCGFVAERLEIAYPDGVAVRYNCILKRDNP